MKTLSLLALFLSFALHAQTDCPDSLEELVSKSEINKEVLSKYLNLQAGITLHKIAYGAYRSSGAPQEFKLENEILRLLEKREKEGEASPEFKKTIELFQDPNNSVSRTALARALPYVQNLLNDQRKEESQFERKMFNLGPADIKMVALLAERESFVQGHYGSKFYKDRDSDNSILNFTKIIDSSIRNFKSLDPERMLRRIATLQKRATELLNELDISKECKELVGNCVLRKGDAQGLSPDFQASLLAIAKEVDFPDKYDRLRYNDVWLYAGKYQKGPSQKGPIGKKTDEKRGTKSGPVEDLSVSPEKALANYYANRVLEVAPSLFSKEELIKDPEFSRALVMALDQGLLEKKGEERTFIYKGRTYYFPELWNNESREKEGGKLKWAWGKAMELKEKADDWWPVAGTRRFFQGLGLEALEVAGLDIEEKFPHIKKDDLPDFLSVWNRQKTGHGQKFTFVFQNKIYDMENGKELEKGIGPLLNRFDADKVARGEEDIFDSKGAEKMAAEELLKGNESFIINGKAFHLSGAKIDFERAYKKAKKEHEEVGIRSAQFPDKETVAKLKEDPESLKVLADGKRAYIKNGKAYDIFRGGVLSAFETSSEVAKNRSLQGVKRSPADYAGMGQDYLRANAVASLNKEPHFFVKGKRYDTNTGRSSKSGLGNSAQAGLDNLDLIKEKYDSLANRPKKLIATFEKEHGKCSVYATLDKAQARLKVLDKNSSRILFSAEALIGASSGDEKTQYFGGIEGAKTNGKTAAGVFELGDLDSDRGLAYNGGKAALALGVVGLQRSNLLYDGDLENNLATDGSVLLQREDYEKLKRSLPSGCPLYSLPQSDKAQIVARDQQLRLVTNGVSSDLYQVTHARKSPPKAIKIKLNEAVEVNSEAKDFLSALEENKPRIMKDLGVTNEEYNELAKIAFGVMGVESQFGEGLEVFPDGFSLKNFFNPRRHKEKSYGGAVVFLGKLLSRGEATIDPDSRSRGLTQIKAVEDYPAIKKFGGITRDSLMEPEKAAIATMYVLGEMYSQLEKTKQSHSGINEANKIDYLYYIYNGQSRQIKNSNATPELNARARKAKEFADLLDVYGN